VILAGTVLIELKGMTVMHRRTDGRLNDGWNAWCISCCCT